ncbi:hydrolase [Bacillus mangrovi]|uniref:Hydrolase n=1 Tax=Metabacillus mangrovi TaxID=1491830 RepID=A0A7X2S6A5_9BACI|nr:hydrolase [Metabacillus mangrovi]
MSEKRTYYVTVGSGEISQLSDSSAWNYRIEATDDEIIQLREYFDQQYASDWKGFFRTHVPYVQYHFDRPNDEVDSANLNIYRMIYELGDSEAKQHIAEQKILNDISDQT